MKKLLITLCLFSYLLPSFGQTVKTYHAEKLPVKKIFTSAPLREIPSRPLVHHDDRKIKDNPSLENPPVYKDLPLDQIVKHDAAWQRIYGDTTTAITLLSNWEGLSTDVDPSDNTLAVSENYIIQMTNNWTNSFMRIWDKAGTLIASNIETADITGFSDYGDPNIIYDEEAGRFIFCLLRSFGNKLVVCISQTDDPMGAWDGYELSTPGGFPDYPKIAVWGNSYFITTNSNLPTIWAMNRDMMLAGDGLGDAQKFTYDDLGTIDFESLAPVTVNGTTIPAGPEMIIRVADDAWTGIDYDHLELFFADINWDDVGLSTLTGPYELAIADFDSYLCGFNSWNCIDQPGPTKLDPIGNIIMDKAQYRHFGDHESVVCSHVCNADGDGTAGVRWYELRKDTTDWYVYQQGTYSPDDHHRWMSSVSINQYGSIALGYNISSEEIHPGIRITARAACDSLNKMTAVEMVAQAGAGSNNINRYGDYNAVVADPVDGTFWLTCNYNPNSSWATRVIHFAVDTCSALQDTTHTDTTNTYIGNQAIYDLTLQPNPANQFFTITFTAMQSTAFELTIYDIAGEKVFSNHYDVPSGANSLTVKTGTIANGNYICTISNGDIYIRKKLVVMK